MNSKLAFPTPFHQSAAEVALDFFIKRSIVDTVLVTNSCARGQGTPDSDLDMCILVKPETTPAEIQELEAQWQEVKSSHAVIRQFKDSHRFMQLHLDVVTGKFTPEVWDDGGGPDGFELGVGNLLAYAAPFHNAGNYYKQLQAEWLPYYGSELRDQRLSMSKQACIYDLDHVPLYFKRELYFQAFDRLYKAFQEFLQALFISKKVYPLAYNKWIRMQVEEWLGLPELYKELPPLISVSDITSEELLDKSARLRELVNIWVV
jgi:predicted nucleotidyltransferase